MDPDTLRDLVEALRTPSRPSRVRVLTGPNAGTTRPVGQRSPPRQVLGTGLAGRAAERMVNHPARSM